MRRLVVSVFSKRSDKSEMSGDTVDGHNAPYSAPAVNSSSTSRSRKGSRLFHTKASPHTDVSNELIADQFTPVRPQVYSSSSSSSGSASLQTPEDDGMCAAAAVDAHKPVLSSWLARQKTVSTLRPKAIRPAQGMEVLSRPAPPFQQPPPPRNLNNRRYNDDSEEGTSSEESDDSKAARQTQTSKRVIGFSVAPSSSNRSQARANLKSLITRSLEPSSTPPPCLYPPSGRLFPRSVNNARSLPFQESFESKLHKTRLLRRLEQSKLSLSQSEERSIAPFASKTATPQSRPRGPDLAHHNASVPDKRHIESFSEGLRRWTCRPCFEERTVVWTPSPNRSAETGISYSRVEGNDRGLGVAALEYSEGLQALAEGVVTDFADKLYDSSTTITAALSSPIPPVLVSPSPEDDPEPSSASSSSSQFSVTNLRNVPPLPSPLRMESVTPHSPVQSSPSSLASPSSTASPVTPVSHTNLTIPDPTSSAPKPSVRFAGLSDKDDPEDASERIPLGYAIRLKKQREEKAKFLKEEREKRGREDENRKRHEEKRKQDEERKKYEAEKQRWEQERRAWEKEKKAIEEERKQKMYREELAAARARRDMQRRSVLVKEVVESADKYARPVYDPSSAHPHPQPRRQNSEPVPPRSASTSRTSMVSPTPSATGSSARPTSSASRPPSVASRPPSSASQVRPSSLYSAHPQSSSEDVRMKERGRKSSRHSVVADANSSAPSAFVWPAVPPVPALPAMVPQQMLMPPMGGTYPVAGMMDNMPLLPPTAPFMMAGQRDRSRSRSGGSRRESSQDSRSSSHSRPQSLMVSNPSSERVNVHGTNRPSSRTSNSNPNPPTTSSRSHSRRPSGESSSSRPSISVTGRSHSDVDPRQASLRGRPQATPPVSQRPMMTTSASWGGPWAAYPVQMPMVTGPAAYPSPSMQMLSPQMLSPSMARGGSSSQSRQRQSVIF